MSCARRTRGIAEVGFRPGTPRRRGGPSWKKAERGDMQADKYVDPQGAFVYPSLRAQDCTARGGAGRVRLLLSQSYRITWLASENCSGLDEVELGEYDNAPLLSSSDSWLLSHECHQEAHDGSIADSREWQIADLV